MNSFIALNNKCEGKDVLIKALQYFSLFLTSNLEASSPYKKRFYDTYCTFFI